MYLNASFVFQSPLLARTISTHQVGTQMRDSSKQWKTVVSNGMLCKYRKLRWTNLSFTKLPSILINYTPQPRQSTNFTPEKTIAFLVFNSVSLINKFGFFELIHFVLLLEYFLSKRQIYSPLGPVGVSKSINKKSLAGLYLSSYIVNWGKDTVSVVTSLCTLSVLY